MNRNIDLYTLTKVALPVALVILVVVYLIARKMIYSYLNLRNQVRVQENAMRMRQADAKGNAQQAIVRRTDIFEQLSPQQRIVHKQAETLEAQKNFREAAKLYESINFQRKAIDLLEFNGFIEDAAQTLLRMKVPFRAAVVYERNRQFIKAAECFIMDQKHDSAARAYEKAADDDFHLYLKAAESFRSAGMMDQALESYSKMLMTQDILKICLASQKLEFLATYMADPYVAKEVLAALNIEQAKTLVGSLKLRPSWVQSMSLWVQYKNDLAFFQATLDRLVEREDLANLFWSHITGPYFTYLAQHLQQTPTAFTRKVYDFHARILTSRNQHALAEVFVHNAQQSAPPSF